jgi:hypothetical protein
MKDKGDTTSPDAVGTGGRTDTEDGSAGDGGRASGGASGAGGNASGGVIGAGGAKEIQQVDAGDSGVTQGSGGMSDAGADTGGPCVNGSCVSKIGGDYLVRSDGVILFENPDMLTQTPVVDPTTGVAATGFTDVTVGGAYEDYGCGLKSDGSVWCWASTASGGNEYGQLGNGKVGGTPDMLRASQVMVKANTPLSDVVAFASAPVGIHTTCAITTKGNMFCWGDVTWVTGTGNQVNSGLAQVITVDGLKLLSGVKQAAVALGGGCAVVTAGASSEVWCWGANGAHELAQGDTTNQQYPVRVPGLTSPSFVISSISSNAGPAHTNCAIDGGEVRCWGLNGGTNIAGGGDAVDVSTPTQILVQDGKTPISEMTSLAATDDAFCGVRSNQTVWCWGAANKYATNLGAIDVVGLGSAGPPVRFITSDGIYHFGTDSTETPRCGAL